MFSSSKSEPSWRRFHNNISRYQLYAEEDGIVDEVIRDLQTQKVQFLYWLYQRVCANLIVIFNVHVFHISKFHSAKFFLHIMIDYTGVKVISWRFSTEVAASVF